MPISESQGSAERPQQPLFPSSSRELILFCREKRPIIGPYRYAMTTLRPGDPGYTLLPWGEVFAGTYGIQRIDLRTLDVVAKCGFDLTRTILEIAQTPQGVKPGEATNRVRSKFKTLGYEFREEMMGLMISTARGLGKKFVQGRSASMFLKSYAGTEAGIEAIDGQFLKAGFVLNDTGFYELDISL